MKRVSTAPLVVVVCSLLTCPVRAEDVVTLEPESDNWISSCSTGCTENNGDMNELRVRTSWWGPAGGQEPKNFRMIMRFDLSSLPVDAGFISEALLGLYYYDKPHDDPAARTYNVFAATNAWDEMTSTWQIRHHYEPDLAVYWDMYWLGEPGYQPGGGDFAETLYASIQVPAQVNEWMTWDVTLLARAWGRGDFANHGLIIMDANEVESDPGGGTFSYLARFRSREYSNSAFWPYLEVVLRDELPGDLNCDGLINAFDIDPFVLALSSPEAYELAYPHCNLYNADINGDGLVNAFDIDPFVELLTAE